MGGQVETFNLASYFGYFR